jgi:hypothetical protein
MNNTSTGIGVVLIVILLVAGGIWMMQGQGNTSPSEGTFTTEIETPVIDTVGTQATSSGDAMAAPGTADSGEKSYSMTEVAMHKEAASCWSAIDGNVYDLTSWIAKHPGGRQAIMGLCGTDGTEKFHGQHGENKQQADALATMKIGILEN